MGYYDTQKGIDEYVEMAEGYDGRELIAVLKKHLKPGATVLELGMGPGKDLDLLGVKLDLAGREIGVDRPLRPLHHLTPDRDHVLRAQLGGPLGHQPSLGPVVSGTNAFGQEASLQPAEERAITLPENAGDRDLG